MPTEKKKNWKLYFWHCEAQINILSIVIFININKFIVLFSLKFMIYINKVKSEILHEEKVHSQ